MGNSVIRLICALTFQCKMTDSYPTLPHLPVTITDELTPEQQRENRLVWARWILEHEASLDMRTWHGSGCDLGGGSFWAVCGRFKDAALWANRCGTTHCCAGHATAMGGVLGFKMEARFGPRAAGDRLLGISSVHDPDLHGHLYRFTNQEARAWLQRVVDTGGEFCDPLVLPQ